MGFQYEKNGNEGGGKSLSLIWRKPGPAGRSRSEKRGFRGPRRCRKNPTVSDVQYSLASKKKKGRTNSIRLKKEGRRRDSTSCLLRIDKGKKRKGKFNRGNLEKCRRESGSFRRLEKKRKKRNPTGSPPSQGEADCTSRA